jgi:hypothetical protein
MRTNILAPVKTSENSAQFYLNGRVYEMSGNTVSMIENITDSNFSNSIAAFEAFEFSENQIKWYLGVSRFTYNIAENKFAWGNSEVLSESFSKHVFAAGAIRYENLKTAELFESMPTLMESYAVLDMVACFEGNNVSVDLIKTENSIFVHRINNSNKIEKFFEAKNANEALEYVKEQTGEDASTFLIESLEGEAAIIAESNSKIEEYKATIAFLKDQREMLAEADRSLPEIKDADNFILSEIKSWEDKIAEINA